MMLTWTGQMVHLCSVAAYPTPILAGVLADTLLLLRPAKAAGEFEVATRAVGLLQPLALGWSSLAVGDTAAAAAAAGWQACAQLCWCALITRLGQRSNC